MSTVTEIEVDKATFDKIQEAWLLLDRYGIGYNPDKLIWREHDPVVNLLLELLKQAPGVTHLRFTYGKECILMKKEIGAWLPSGKREPDIWRCRLSSLIGLKADFIARK